MCHPMWHKCTSDQYTCLIYVPPAKISKNTPLLSHIVTKICLRISNGRMRKLLRLFIAANCLHLLCWLNKCLGNIICFRTMFTHWMWMRRYCVLVVFVFLPSHSRFSTPILWYAISMNGIIIKLEFYCWYFVRTSQMCQYRMSLGVTRAVGAYGVCRLYHSMCEHI